MNQHIEEQLKQIAYKKSKPFCYGCYQTVETASGRCKTCGSDDNMRLLDGIGCEYGTSWIVQHLLEENLTPFDSESSFEQFVSEVYGDTTKVGFMKFDTATLMKENDPVAWDCALSEWIDNEVSDERLITFDNGAAYYQIDDVYAYIESQ